MELFFKQPMPSQYNGVTHGRKKSMQMVRVQGQRPKPRSVSIFIEVSKGA